ncbi:hypothetical protein OHA25_48685 [Nonomuraea sp. NBC_00507]|uniref:hypothetical protein n=1 Tax=Nonomuraea sp. NBC_00507 TaxID=2976002 RepID=UPI002E18348C
MTVGIFAGIPVRDCKSAVEWYTKLLGKDPAFWPNDVEAVWQLAEDRYVYVIEDAARAGGGARHRFLTVASTQSRSLL